jgi:hypothetical protein
MKFKKVLVILLAAALVLPMLTTGASAASAPLTLSAEALTTRDALTVLQASSGLVTLTAEQRARYGINANSTVSISDALRVLQISAGITEDSVLNARRDYNAAGNVRELLSVSAQWSGVSGTADIIAYVNERVETLRSDSTLSAAIIANPRSATDNMVDSFFNDYPGHRDEQRVRDLFSGNIADLISAGMISVSVVGSGWLNYVDATITNNSRREVSVTIPIGTYFRSGSTSVQNMAVRAPRTVSVAANSNRAINVDTVCMNYHRSEPAASDRLTVAALDSNRLERVLRLLREENATFNVTQLATWIVTDSLTNTQLLNSLGNATQSDVDAARSAVNRA